MNLSVLMKTHTDKIKMQYFNWPKKLGQVA